MDDNGVTAHYNKDIHEEAEHFTFLSDEILSATDQWLYRSESYFMYYDSDYFGNPLGNDHQTLWENTLEAIRERPITVVSYQNYSCRPPSSFLPWSCSGIMAKPSERLFHTAFYHFDTPAIRNLVIGHQTKILGNILGKIRFHFHFRKISFKF